jgi:hypothetical protein
MERTTRQRISGSQVWAARAFVGWTARALATKAPETPHEIYASRAVATTNLLTARGRRSRKGAACSNFHGRMDRRRREDSNMLDELARSPCSTILVAVCASRVQLGGTVAATSIAAAPVTTAAPASATHSRSRTMQHPPRVRCRCVERHRQSGHRKISAQLIRFLRKEIRNVDTLWGCLRTKRRTL